MSPRDWRDRIEDMLEAMNNLWAYVKGMTFEEFAADTKTIRAAAYEIGVIGEAARSIPAEIQERFAHVPWEEMQAMRNVVTHEYFRLDVRILWKTVTEEVPPLVPQLQAILEEEAGEGEGVKDEGAE